jgi:uncharacterized protein (DUF1501 family)
MSTQTAQQIERRAFLRRLSALSMLGPAAPWALQLGALSEAAAATATDYKALVCVFLFGGNDHANTIVPFDVGSYTALSQIRPNLILPQESLASNQLRPGTPLANQRVYALAPGLEPLVPLFHAKELAVLLNIGTLIEPTTKAQYHAKSVRLPPKLFSHNDQQAFWQTSATEGSPSGWGGRIGDLFLSSQSSANLTAISLSGQAAFLSGRTLRAYQITAAGPTPISALNSPLFGSSQGSALMRTLLTTNQSHPLMQEWVTTGRRSIELTDSVSSALAGVTLNTPFPLASSIGDQLKMVARLIGARNALGLKRQVFFVSLGGFDTHDNQASTHPGLIAQIGHSLAAFQQAMRELGVQEKVTTFTASDFGRTLTSNNDGSDHGWGSSHFVMGGAVRGGEILGTPPAIAINGPDDVGSGRFIPTTSVDQLAGSLGQWFGLSSNEQLGLLPNLANFSNRTLALFR